MLPSVSICTVPALQWGADQKLEVNSFVCKVKRWYGHALPYAYFRSCIQRMCGHANIKFMLFPSFLCGQQAHPDAARRPRFRAAHSKTGAMSFRSAPSWSGSLMPSWCQRGRRCSTVQRKWSQTSFRRSVQRYGYACYCVLSTSQCLNTSVCCTFMVVCCDDRINTVWYVYGSSSSTARCSTSMCIETCLRRPFKGPSECGLCYQVVSLSRVYGLEIASLGPGCSGLLGQVVSLSRVYWLEIASLGPGCSGLLGQFVTEKSLWQVLLELSRETDWYCISRNIPLEFNFVFFVQGTFGLN